MRNDSCVVLCEIHSAELLVVIIYINNKTWEWSMQFKTVIYKLNCLVLQLLYIVISIVGICFQEPCQLGWRRHCPAKKEADPWEAERVAERRRQLQWCPAISSTWEKPHSLSSTQPPSSSSSSTGTPSCPTQQQQPAANTASPKAATSVQPSSVKQQLHLCSSTQSQHR